jgi:Ca2+-binding RTX toxin-like protein
MMGLILFGDESDDYLVGTDKDDQLYGRDGNDTLIGNQGNDFLAGKNGFNYCNGGEGNDTLVGLGELKTGFFGNPIQDEAPNGIEVFTGGSGADRFKLLKAKDDKKRLFVKGQKFVQITDFTPSEGDKIILPGSAYNYSGILYGENNEGTAIIYIEDPDNNFSFSFAGVSVNPSFAIQVDDGIALVAVLEGVTARNMNDSDFYEYTGRD